MRRWRDVEQPGEGERIRKEQERLRSPITPEQALAACLASQEKLIVNPLKDPL